MFLIDKVRANTSALHHALDHSLIPHIEAIQLKNDYAALLLLFYGFFKPVYDNIDKYIDVRCLPDYETRRRPALILNDLEALEVPYNLELCTQLPAVTDNASAFGALYVLEGSTLGGVIIKKMISDKLHTNEGLSFFSGYGKQTRERWNVFIQSLNKMNNHNGAEEAVIQTAATTFVFFKDWLQQSGLNYLQA